MNASALSIRQSGIRQRSLSKHCRFGRATELVFVLAGGAMLVLGVPAMGQAVLQWDAGADAGAAVVTPGPGNWSNAGLEWNDGAGANVTFSLTDTAVLGDAGAPYTVNVIDEVMPEDIRLEGDGITLSSTGAGSIDLQGTLSLTAGNAAIISATFEDDVTIGEIGAGSTLTLSSNIGDRLTFNDATVGGSLVVVGNTINSWAQTAGDVQFSNNVVLTEGGTFNGGTVTLGDGSGVAGPAVTAGQNGIVVGAGVTQFTLTGRSLAGDLTSAATSTLGGDITGTLEVNGAATTTVSSAIEIGGLATVTSGVLDIDASTTLGGGLSVATGATGLLDAATTLGAASSNAGTLDVNAAVLGGQTLTNTGAITLAGTVTGGLSQNEAGASTVVDGASTLSGGFINTAGTVTVNDSLTLGAGSSNAGTLDVNAAVLGGETLTNTGAITLSSAVTGGLSQSAGSTVVDGVSSFSGAVDITGGTLRTDAALTATGGLSVGAGATLDINSDITGNITTAANTATLAGQVTGDYTQTGAGATTSVDGNAGVTGTLDVSGGTLTVQSGNRLDAASIENRNGATIVVASNATLAGTGNTLNNAGALNVADGGAVTDAGAINNLATGTITFAGDAQFDADTDAAGAEPITNDGAIVANGAANEVVTVGADAFINQGTGTLDVNGGTVSGITTLTNSSTSAAAIDVTSGAALGFTQLNSSAGTITSAGALSGAVALSGTAGLDLNAGGQIGGALSNTSTQAITLAGTVTGGLSQNGAGASTVVDGASTLSGGFINTAGTVTVNDSLTLGAASSNAGTLDVNAAVLGGETLTNTGAITLGANLDGALVQNAGGTTVVDASSQITGALDINAGSVTVQASNALSVGSADLEAGATVALLAGASLATTTGNLVNGAAVSVASGGAVSSSAGLTNEAAGTITFADGGTLSAGGAGVGTIDNAGTVTVTGGGVSVTGGDALNNTGAGRVVVDGGSLTGLGTVISSSGGGGQPALDIAAGATLGAARVEASTGEVEVAGTLQAPLTLTGDAILDLQSGGTVSGAVLNGSTGTTTLAGSLSDTYTQNGAGVATTVTGATTATGAIDIDVGRFDVDAVLTATGGLDVAAAATLDIDAEVRGDVTTASNTATLGANIAGAFTQTAGTTTVDADTQISGIGALRSGVFAVGDGFDAIFGDAVTARDELTLSSGTTVTVGTGSSFGVNQATDRAIFETGSTVVLADGATLRGLLDISGTVQARSGTANVTGDAILRSSSALDLVDGATGDQMVFSGGLTASATSELRFDVDLTENAAATDSVVTGGASTGQLDIKFNDITGANTYGALGSNGLTLVDLTAGSTLTATGDGPVDPDNAFVYSVEQNALGDIALISRLNDSTLALAGAISSSQSLISTVINRPTSPYVTSPAQYPEEGVCPPGGWARAIGGSADVQGTASTSNSSVQTNSSSSFGGMQFGIDTSCLNNLSGTGGWDMTYGVIGGFNVASTTQPVQSTVGAVSSSVLSLDLEQYYAGGYISGARDSLLFDVQGRYERTDYTVNSSTITGAAFAVDDSTFATDAYTLLGSMSYVFEVPNFENVYFVPTIGASVTHTGASTLQFTNGTRLEIDAATTAVGFVGGQLSLAHYDEDTRTGTEYNASITGYSNMSSNPTSSFVGNAGAPVTVEASSLSDFAELSVGYSISRSLATDSGDLRRLSASFRLDGRLGNDFDSYGLTAQLRYQF